MLNFPLWKRLAIILVCLAGLWVSFPNLFYSQVERSNDAREAIAAGREADPADITWPEFLPNGLVNLGLDLRGGAHVLAEVATADVEAERLEGLWPLVRDELRDERDVVGTVRRLDSPPDELRVRIGDPTGMEAALEAVRAASQPVFSLTGAASRDFEAVERVEGALGVADHQVFNGKPDFRVACIDLEGFRGGRGRDRQDDKSNCSFIHRNRSFSWLMENKTGAVPNRSN